MQLPPGAKARVAAAEAPFHPSPPRVPILVCVGRSIAMWAALLASAIPTTANARPSARLVYSRAAGAESCPDERALRAAVAERVGYDPFFAWVKQAVVASMAPDGKRGFVARIRLVDEQGTEAGTRDLHADGACADLLDTAALAIAIAIDPQSLTPRPVAEKPAPPQPPPPPPPPPDAGAEEEEAPEPTPAPAGSPVMFDAIAGVVASAGVAPAPAVGARLGAEARWRDVSIGLEGRIDAPAASEPVQGGGRVSSRLIVATLAPCAHAGPLFACALVQAGQIRASGDVTGGLDQWTSWWGAGGRLGVLARVSHVAAFRLASDVVGDLVRPRLRLNGPPWEAPAVAGSLGVDLVVHFQ
jgi:hypothetical protein